MATKSTARCPVREVHNERSLWLHDWIGEKSFCTEESRLDISIRNKQQQLSDRSANSKLAPNRLLGDYSR